MIKEELDSPSIDLTEDLWWVFYLKNAQTIDTLQPLLYKFSQIGLHLIDTYLDKPHLRLIFQGENENIYYQLSNPSDDALPYLFLGTVSEQFIPPDSLTARLYADQFLEYGKVCYRILQPFYAFAENMNLDIERENIETYRLTHICWAQLFGADFVRGIGQEILSNAPAWRNENLGDGGLLYVLATSPYLYQGARQYWQEARDYFRPHISSPILWSDLPE